MASMRSVSDVISKARERIKMTRGTRSFVLANCSTRTTVRKRGDQRRKSHERSSRLPGISKPTATNEQHAPQLEPLRELLLVALSCETSASHATFLAGELQLAERQIRHSFPHDVPVVTFDRANLHAQLDTQDGVGTKRANAHVSAMQQANGQRRRRQSRKIWPIVNRTCAISSRAANMQRYLRRRTCKAAQAVPGAYFPA